MPVARASFGRSDRCWAVYILRCADGSLYTGATSDLSRRLLQHDRGMAAAYTRSRRPVLLVFGEPAASKSAALRREAALKRLSRAEKLLLIGKRGGPGTRPRAVPLGLDRPAQPRHPRR